MRIGLAQSNKDSDPMPLIQDAIKIHCDMVLFPELVPVIKTKDYGIIVGSGYEEKTLLGKPYNTYEIIGDKTLLKYRKQNMFPGYDDNRRPGNKMPYAIIKGKKIYVAICFDIRNSWTFKQMDKPDAIIIAADFPEIRIKDWTGLLQQRAYENNSYIFGVNTSDNGYSMIVKRDGNVLCAMSKGEGLLLGDILL